MTPGQPKLFTITFNAVKVNRLRKAEQEMKHMFWGTHYTEPFGIVTLANGACFDTLSEMKEHFGKSGRYVIEWEHGERESNA